MARKSPLNEILSDPKASMRLSKNFVSLMWRKILTELKMSPRGSHGVDKDQFQKLLKEWKASEEKIRDPSSVAIDRANLTKALAVDAMTWRSFALGLKVLNATKAFKRIRIELHFYWNDDEAQIIGLNFMESKRDNRPIQPTHRAPVAVLRPGNMVYVGLRCKLEGFKLCPWNGRTVQYHGLTNMHMAEDHFANFKEVPGGLAREGFEHAPEWKFLEETS